MQQREGYITMTIRNVSQAEKAAYFKFQHNNRAEIIIP